MIHKAEGERWVVTLSEERPHEGTRPLIFRCDTNSSRGWRVVEVTAGDWSDERVESLSSSELSELFDRAQPFDYAHDPKAVEGHIGDSGTSR